LETEDTIEDEKMKMMAMLMLIFVDGRSGFLPGIRASQRRFSSLAGYTYGLFTVFTESRGSLLAPELQENFYLLYVLLAIGVCGEVLHVGQKPSGPVVVWPAWVVSGSDFLRHALVIFSFYDDRSNFHEERSNKSSCNPRHHHCSHSSAPSTSSIIIVYPINEA
jgi:hypothetical protein